jgi:hypothetical protein
MRLDRGHLGALEDPRTRALDRNCQAPDELRRMHPRARGVEQRATGARHAHAGAQRLGIEPRPIARIGAKPPGVDVVDRHAQRPALDEVAVDLLARHGRRDLVDGLADGRHQGRRRPAGQIADDPAAVAPGSAEPRRLALEHHDVELRRRSPELQRRPQAGHPRAHDRDIALERAGKRIARAAQATEVIPPEGHEPMIAVGRLRGCAHGRQGLLRRRRSAV